MRKSGRDCELFRKCIYHLDALVTSSRETELILSEQNCDWGFSWMVQPEACVCVCVCGEKGVAAVGALRLNYLKMTWLAGACYQLPAAVWAEGLAGGGLRPSSGSAVGFALQTASGSGSGPGPRRCGHSAPGPHRLDADLGGEQHASETPAGTWAVWVYCTERTPSLKASPSGRTSLTKILLFFWLSMCPVTAKPCGKRDKYIQNIFEETR